MGYITGMCYPLSQYMLTSTNPFFVAPLLEQNAYFATKEVGVRLTEVFELAKIKYLS